MYDLYSKHRINVKFQYLETKYSRESSASAAAIGMRVSVAYFNTEAEVRLLLDALRAELKPEGEL